MYCLNTKLTIDSLLPTHFGAALASLDFALGAFHLVRTQFNMLSGPPPPLFACNTQCKCIGDLTPPSP